MRVFEWRLRRYPMTTEEKGILRRYYALRWWERDGGFAGDVDPAEVQAIHDKYDPGAVDLREYERAKAAGKLDEYWEKRADVLQRLTGSRVLPSAEPAGKELEPLADPLMVLKAFNLEEQPAVQQGIPHTALAPLHKVLS